MIMGVPPVSVCIAAYNAASTIGPLLDSLLALEYPEYEVIVVDDGSSDRTPEIVTEYADEDHRIQLFRQENEGASSARNQAVELASNDIIAFTDSDTRVDSGWLDHLVQPFEDKQVGATTGRTIFETNKTCTSWVRSVDIAIRNDRRRKKTRLANGPNCAFRRTALKEVGGFDPDWFHAEDTAVSYELYEQGYEIHYVPDAIVYHVPEDDWRDYLRKRYRDAKAFTRVILTHPTSAAVKDDFVPFTWRVQPPLFGLLLMGLPFAFLFGRISLGAWLSLFGIGTLLNLPFARQVARRAESPSFFFKSLALSTFRGYFWGAGLTVGGVFNILKYGPPQLRG